MLFRSLYALIICLGPVSGAQFNPVVTIALATGGVMPWRRVASYVAAQCAGAVFGVWLAHAMFGLPLLQASTHIRSTSGEWLGEVIATFGLIAIIESLRRRASVNLPGAVALYIVGAYWFTSSTSFANPAVTLARAMTDTFAGIAPASVLAFIIAQSTGGSLAVLFVRWLELGASRRAN